MQTSSRTDRKASGAHYTPPILANFVAEQIILATVYHTASRQIRVLDPAVGDGELLLSLLRHLQKPERLCVDVFGLDTDPKAIDAATIRIRRAFSNVPMSITNSDFLDFVLDTYTPNEQNDLFRSPHAEFFDIVIANPPYVRTQIMGSARAQKLARHFELSGRIDLYHAFIEAISRVLKPGAVAGIIVSNRFLTTRSGAGVRKRIIRNFDVLHVWDLGDTRLFAAAVLPAVLLLRRKNGKLPRTEPRFTSIYQTACVSAEQKCSNVIDALSKTGIVQVTNGNCYRVLQGVLDYGGDPTAVWQLNNEFSRKWLSKVKANTFCTFGTLGKIRVGVKTTADRVFIRSDWADMPETERPELIRPLITHHIARRFRAAQGKTQRGILYTHQVINGKRVPINLDDFPRSANYLSIYRPLLEKRGYIQRAGRKWYEIWVPHDPEAWAKPKLVFRDISEIPTFWMDLSGSIVNGDCYWLVCKDTYTMDMLWLALATANSSFAAKFYDFRFNNKLYSGRRRFITQYVEQFPLPDPSSSISKQIVQIAQDLYNSVSLANKVKAMERELDELVWQAFGLKGEEIIR